MRKPFRLALASLLIGMQSLGSVAHAQAASGAGLTPDAEPPVIEIETIDSGVAGMAQVFTAQVVDDRELVDVILYHRRAGDQPFDRAFMTPIAATAFYSATLATDPDDPRAIEYYVQARDGGGNRTVSGYAFDPYTRSLEVSDVSLAPAVTPLAVPPSLEAGGSPTDDTGLAIGGVPWWQIALGAVAVGALAAVAGGSGGGGDDDDGTVPLTINLGEPQ